MLFRPESIFGAVHRASNIFNNLAPKIASLAARLTGKPLGSILTRPPHLALHQGTEELLLADVEQTLLQHFDDLIDRLR